jgi:hypothetical protein
MRDGYLRGELVRPTPTPRQRAALAAYVRVGGSVADAASLLGIRPSTVKRHLADLRARLGFSTEQLIYAGRAAGWLSVVSLEPPLAAARGGSDTAGDTPECHEPAAAADPAGGATVDSPDLGWGSARIFSAIVGTL